MSRQAAEILALAQQERHGQGWPVGSVAHLQEQAPTQLDAPRAEVRGLFPASLAGEGFGLLPGYLQLAQGGGEVRADHRLALLRGAGLALLGREPTVAVGVTAAEQDRAPLAGAQYNDEFAGGRCLGAAGHI